MNLLLWMFWTYSFLGWLLEMAYGAAAGTLHHPRKGFLLLPLCPVYGLGALAILALPETGGLLLRAALGGLAATVTEYLVHLAYDRFCNVRFWDYTGLPGSVRGRVCLPFSLAWGVLSLALPPIQGWLTPLFAAVPEGVTYGALLLFTADAVASLHLLRVTGDRMSLRFPLAA